MLRARRFALWLPLGFTIAHSLAPAPAVSAGWAADIHVEVADNRVSLRARDAPMQEVLDELASRTGLVVVAHESLQGRLTLELHGAALDEALRHVLHGRSFLLHQTHVAPFNENVAPGGLSHTLWIFSSALEVPAPEAANATPGGRLTALRTASRLSSDQAVAVLSRALTDPDPTVRVKAMYGLTSTGGDQAVAALAAGLADENAGAREEAAYALGMVGSTSAIPFLEHALRDPDVGVRRAAIRALADTGGEAAAAALRAVMRDTDPALREESVAALEAIGGRTALLALRDAMHDPDEHVRKAAREALADLSSRKP